MMFKILITLTSGLLMSCGSNQAEDATRQMAARMTPVESNLAVEVWQQLNAYRSSIKEKPIAVSRGLISLAQEHANYLSTTGGIVADEKFAFGSRSIRVYRDYGMDYVTEYIYMGEPNAAAVINTWRMNKTYLSNLKTNWNHCGVGVAISPTGEAHVVMITALKNAGNRNVGPKHRF